MSRAPRGVLGLIFILIMTNVAGATAAPGAAREVLTLPQCIALLTSDTPSVQEFNQATDACYTYNVKLLSVNDFNLRRQGFSDQSYFGSVILWMMVFITVSGVILSGLQLLSAHVLARSGVKTAGGSNAITIERERLVFRSSVAGLMILLISLAFFFIFVKYIYVLVPMEDRPRQPPYQIRSGTFVPNKAPTP